MASLADYAVAYALAAQVLAETLSDVKKPLREAYERVRELALKGDGSVSRREIREALAGAGLDGAALAADLVELEYLAQVEAEQGRRGQDDALPRSWIASPRARSSLGLLTPEDLRTRL